MPSQKREGSDRDEAPTKRVRAANGDTLEPTEAAVAAGGDAIKPEAVSGNSEGLAVAGSAGAGSDQRLIQSQHRIQSGTTAGPLVAPSAEEPINVDSVICTLALPDPHIRVAVDYNNTHTADSAVQAYAKLAGRSWTYYVQQLDVVIGRTAADRDDHVDIDLAPSKVVSRQHALIKYNGHQRQWEVTVLGRNGVRVDKVFQKAGVALPLSSGNVLEIGGVQMMFVLPDQPPRVAPVLLQSRARAEARARAKAAPGMMPIGAPGAPGAPGANSYSGTAHALPSGSPINAESQRLPAGPPQLGVNASINGPNVGTSSSGSGSTNGNSNEPRYPRGVAIVSRPQVAASGWHYFEQDLSTDECKDIKPPFSYATMISQAILSAPEHMMSLADIYAWISSHYAFYRHSKPGWQNSIRHNLSLNKAFEKVARPVNEPGKGSKWQIAAEYKDEFMLKATTGRNYRGRNTTSPRRSPSRQDGASVRTQIPPPPQSQSDALSGMQQQNPPHQQQSPQLMQQPMSVQPLPMGQHPYAGGPVIALSQPGSYPENTVYYATTPQGGASPATSQRTQPNQDPSQDQDRPDDRMISTPRLVPGGPKLPPPSASATGSSPALWQYMHLSSTPGGTPGQAAAQHVDESSPPQPKSTNESVESGGDNNTSSVPRSRMAQSKSEPQHPHPNPEASAQSSLT